MRGVCKPAMALHNIIVRAHPKAVWEVLADPHSYQRWVPGTKRIVRADPDWPEPGSAFEYEAGIGSLKFRGQTVARGREEGSHLEIEADAKLLAARVAISVKPWGDDSLVVVEEHWIRGSYLLLENPIVDLALNIRNRVMVKYLAREVQRRSHRPTPASQ